MKRNLNSDNQQFYLYQQNEQSCFCPHFVTSYFCSNMIVGKRNKMTSIEGHTVQCPKERKKTEDI